MREQGVLVQAEPEIGRKIFSMKLFVVAFFVIVLLLLFFAFFDSFNIGGLTGNLLKIGDSNSTEIIDENPKILAELGEIQSQLEFKQKIDKILIEIQGNGNQIYFGKKGLIDLSNTPSAKISIEGFEGKILFDGEKIISLKGSVSKLIVNDYPPTSSTDGEIDIRIETELPYRYLELDSISLKSYESIGSGTVKFGGGKVLLELDNETFLVENFFGILKSGIVSNLGIQRKGLTLEGSAENVEIAGEEFKMSLRG